MIKVSESRNKIRVVVMTLPPIAQQQNAIANGKLLEKKRRN